MDSARFLQNRVSRIVKFRGKHYTFTRVEKDKYHKETGNSSSIELDGVFHEGVVYKSQSGSDAGMISAKPTPMIMCLWDVGKVIQEGDKVVINEKNYHVTEIEDIQNYSVACEISLEVVQ